MVYCQLYSLSWLTKLIYRVTPTWIRTKSARLLGRASETSSRWPRQWAWAGQRSPRSWSTPSPGRRPWSPPSQERTAVVRTSEQSTQQRLSILHWREVGGFKLRRRNSDLLVLVFSRPSSRVRWFFWYFTETSADTWVRLSPATPHFAGVDILDRNYYFLILHFKGLGLGSKAVPVWALSTKILVWY